LPWRQVHDPCANLLEHSRHFIADDHWGLRAVRIQALTGEHIGKVDPNSLYGNTHCPGRDVWLGHVLQVEHLGWTIP
jgi:hypothetical protein